MERDDLGLDSALLDHELDRLPLAPLPEGFVTATMERIAARPRFHIHFLDVAIPFSTAVLVFSLISVVLWFAGTLSTAWLPPPPVTFSPEELVPAFLNAVPWLGVALLLLAIEGGLALVAGACVALWIDRSTTYSA